MCCALVADETRQHLLPGLGSKGADLPYVANKIIISRGHSVHMVLRWRLYRYVQRRLLVDLSRTCVPAICHLSSSIRISEHKISTYLVGFPTKSIPTACVPRMAI